MRKNFTRVASMALVLLLLMLPGSGMGSNNIKFTTGFIAAVGIEMDEQGHPRLAEYDSEGRFVADVGYLAVDIPEDAILYPAASWRAFEQFHNDLIAANPEATRGARLLSVEQYDKQNYTTRGAALPVSKPGLLPGTKSVLVIAEDRMLNPDPGKEGFILAEYPVDLRQMGNVAADDVTLILNAKGQVLRASKFDISFKAAVYREDGRSKNTAEERIWQPIPNVNVEVDVFGGYGSSGPDGRYSVTYAMPPCPGFSYNLDIPIVATLYFDNFNPKNKDDSDNQGFLSAIRYDNKSCVGYGFGAIATSLTGQLAQLNAQAATSLISTPLNNFDLTFSTMLLNAVGTMPGVKLADETVYTADNSQIADLAEYNFDFNLDGLPDTAVPNPDDPNKIDIYYSPRPVTNEKGERNPPDFTRVADKDFNSQLAYQGLLSEISREDLENTDIYIYRRSTGQRLGSIEGLLTKTADDGIVRGGTLNNGRATYRGVHEDKEFATFGFTSYLTGAVSSDWWSNLNNYSLKDKTNRRPWLPSETKAAGFTSDNPPDSLRPGEVIQIIAINRATGYIGTQDIITQPSGTPLEPPAPIQMGPPNLKIIASREFEDFNELSKSTDKKINIIGSEGAGLTSDTYVKIQTVWLTQTGDVLPDDLPGYTGRLAISTGSATEDFSGNFEIRPGYQTQVVQLNNAADLTKEHFYVQVIGEHIDGNPSFESPGAGAGKLQTRPKKYVPILVPIFDEATTRAAQEALAIARLDGAKNLPDRADATYRWVYRPEMQFSVFELQQDRLQISFEDLVGGEQAINLSEISQEEFNDILDDISFLDFLYDLSGGDVLALDSFGPPRNLIFSIGGQEVQATQSSNGVIRFENIEHLNALSSRDFLTLSLYENSDSANVLWEWAFARGLAGAPREALVSADEPEVEIVAYLPIVDADSNESPKTVTVSWEVHGPGGLLSEKTSVSNIGLFVTTLRTQQKADEEYYVTATIDASEDDRFLVGDSLTLGPYTVVAGEPGSIQLQGDSNTVQANETTKIPISAVVFDAHGNRVSDGTLVTWELEYDGDLLNPVTETTNGMSSVEYLVGDKLLDSEVILQAGSVSQQFNLVKTEVTATLSVGSTSLPANGSTTTFLSVSSNADDNTPVEWNSTHGRIINAQESITNGLATATLVASSIPGDGTVMVNVADATDSQVVDFLGVGGLTARFEYAAIVAADSPGSVTVETLNGNVQHDYINSTNVIITGEANEELTLEVGGFFTPNAPPSLHFAMDGIIVENPGTASEMRYVSDKVSGIHANIMGGVDDDLLKGFTRPGSSLALHGGYLLVNSQASLEIPDDLFANVRFSRSTADENQKLFIKGDIATPGYALTLINGGTTLQAKVTTDQGVFTVEATTPIEQDTWYIAGIRLRNGRLELGLNDERRSVDISGQMIGDGLGIVFGAGFKGNLDDIKIGRESVSNSLLVFGNGNLTKDITLDANGRATLPVRATGNTVSGGGQLVGFTARQTSSITNNVASEKELQFAEMAVTALSHLMGIGVVYAQEPAGAQEGGLAVSTPETWGALAEWVGKGVFGESFDTIKRVAQFVFELTAIGDIYVLAKALVSLVRSGNIGDTDAFEITFATVGIGITVLTVFTGGAALPLKGGLIAIRPILRELFETGITAAIKVGILAGKFLFRQIKEFVTNPTQALRQIRDSAEAFGKVILDTSGRALKFLFRSVRSIPDLLSFIKAGSRGAEACSAIPAGKLCGESLFAKLADLANDTARFGSNTANAGKAAALMTRVTNLLVDQGRALTDDQLQGLIEVGVKRLVDGTSEVKGLEQMEAMLRGMAGVGELERATRTINRIAKLNPVPAGFDSVLAQAASRNVNDVRGVLHVLSDIDAGGIPLDQIKAFEENVFIDIVDAAGTKMVKRRLDVLLKDGSTREFKAWEAGDVRWTEDIRREFIKDILSRRSFQWVIHQNADIAVLRDRMLCLLGSGKDGRGRPCVINTELLNSLGDDADDVIDILIDKLKTNTQALIRHGEISDAV